jgi:hypothetical protein
VVECQPNKHKALNSSHSTTQKKPQLFSACKKPQWQKHTQKDGREKMEKIFQANEIQKKIGVAIIQIEQIRLQ